MAQRATDRMRLAGDMSMLVGIDMANIPAETVLNRMFDRLMDTLREGIPDIGLVPRRKRNPKVTELARKIFQRRFNIEPEPSDLVLIWIEANIVKILNNTNTELRQLKRDYNPLPLTHKRSQELLVILDRVEARRASSAT